MKASVLDLRYRMKEILKALEENEQVTILYHGKAKGVIVPAARTRASKVADHPFFGMKAEEGKSVVTEMKEFREGRAGAL